MRTNAEHSGWAVDDCGLALGPDGHQKAVGAGQVGAREPDGAKAMQDVEMTIQVAQDRTLTAIEIAPLGQAPHRLVLALDELDTLIRELGSARSKMVEGQSPPDFEGEEVTISTVANAKWHIRAYPPTGALLAFYHPKFGPVGFTLARDQIARIVSFLTERFILHPTQSAEKH
jgi:hypothetical protein